jgi:hypothetical protein
MTWNEMCEAMKTQGAAHANANPGFDWGKLLPVILKIIGAILPVLGGISGSTPTP